MTIFKPGRGKHRPVCLALPVMIIMFSPVSGEVRHGGAPQRGPAPNKSQAEALTPPPSAPESLPPPSAEPASDCAARLALQGIEVERPAVGKVPADQACRIADAIVLKSTIVPDAADLKVQFPDHPLLSCAMAERFSRYVQDIASPLAKGIYEQSLVEISTGPGFECRTRNHQLGAKISSHGAGDAVDIAALTLAHGVRVSVEKPASDKDRRLLAGLRAAGCGAFSTVLGPGSDAAHKSHLHFDIERRGRDGASKFCQ